MAENSWGHAKIVKVGPKTRLRRKIKAQVRRAIKTDAEKLLNRAKLQAATGCRRKAIQAFQKYLLLTKQELL